MRGLVYAIAPEQRNAQEQHWGQRMMGAANVMSEKEGITQWITAQLDSLVPAHKVQQRQAYNEPKPWHKQIPR